MQAGGFRFGQMHGVFALLLLAFATRLIPAGYMPVVTPQGSITVSLCTPAGVKQMTIALDTGDGERSSKGDAGDHSQPDNGPDNAMPACAFAMASGPMLGLSAPLVLVSHALPLREIALPPPAGETAPQSFPHTLPPLRGPPAVV